MAPQADNAVMTCQTPGCTRSTTYGGRCPDCEILFGPYDRVVEKIGKEEVDWFAANLTTTDNY